MATGSTVIDLNDASPSVSGNIMDAYANVPPSQSDQSTSTGFPGTGDISQAVASQVWISGKQKAKQYASIYGNIDILRPYFDVEPRTVLIRLARTFVPVMKSKNADIPNEMYGPTMLLFTLVALLLYSMKVSDHAVQDGTLIGTALGVCFGYWSFAAFVIFFLSYISNCALSFVQVLSLTGYSFTAPCLIVLLSTVFHPVHDHIFFYFLWITLGGVTAARIATALASRVRDPGQRITLMGVSAGFHMLFMLYLHFAYHSTVETVKSITD